MRTELREQILSEENIYKAIFAMESYISERDLLNPEDLDTFLRLRDKYDFNGIVSDTIEKCKKTLNQLLDCKQPWYGCKEHRVSFQTSLHSKCDGYMCLSRSRITIHDGASAFPDKFQCLQYRQHGLPFNG